MMKTSAVASAMLMLATVASAQATPNFAGKWQVVPNAAAPAAGTKPSMGSGWAREFTIAQDANALTLEYTPYVASDVQPAWKFVYPLTGAETTQTIDTGHGDRALVSRAVWNGGTLVITTTQRFKNPDTGALMSSEVRRALSLDSDGRLVVETTYIGVMGGPTSTTRTLYAKN